MVDASVLGPALTDDTEDGDRVRARLDGTLMWAPGLIDLEILSFLRRAVQVGDLEEPRARLAWGDLAQLRLRRVGHELLAARIWELRHNLTPYDAAYVVVAERLRATLLTGDGHLARAPGPVCAIELME